MSRRRTNNTILIIAPTPFFADRGCHVRILEEIKASMVLGYAFVICTYHLGRAINGLDIRRSLNIPWYKKLSAGPSIHKFYLDLFLLWVVLKSCWVEKPALIHAHLHEGVFIGKIASVCFRIPLIADIQGSLTGELLQHRFVKEGGFLYRLFQWLEECIIRMPDCIFSSFTKELTQNLKTAEGLKDKIIHIADGVDTTQFRPGLAPDGLKNRLGISEGLKVIGFLGLLTEYQGVSVLLETMVHLFGRMSNIHCLIMGYPNVALYQKKAEVLGISAQVTFTGTVAYEEAPQYLSICDVLISPKFHTTEANGKLLNYMAMGLPIVATDSPVNLDILGSLGIYGKEGDPESFSEGLYRVLRNDSLARQLGQQLRERAIREYSWQAVAQKISASYQKLSPFDPAQGIPV